MSDEEDEFLFESAHLAFRSNADYLKLMKHLTVLCAQRIKVQNDIEILHLEERKAMNDPLAFVEGIQGGVIKFPASIEVPEMPTIDYSKYQTSGSNTQPKSTSPKKTIPVNFWTADEQRKLEELLVKYPPEAIESQRFAKIANEMGNRTLKQIASRVQKFFKKLQEANLPIPGSSTCKPNRNRHRQNKNFLKLEKPSTFFPERDVPSDLLMKEGSDDESELFTPKVQSTDEEINAKISLLKQIKAVKARMSEEVFNVTSGRNCSSCQGKLHLEASWQCCDCKVDYCPDCLTTQLVSASFEHLNHNFVPG